MKRTALAAALLALAGPAAAAAQGGPAVANWRVTVIVQHNTHTYSTYIAPKTEGRCQREEKLKVTGETSWDGSFDVNVSGRGRHVTVGPGRANKDELYKGDGTSTFD